MNSEPEIRIIAEKKYVGKHAVMSFTNNKTFDLWRGFMPRRKEIKNSLGTELYSAEVFPISFFDKFDPTRDFEKWALVEVGDFNNVPLEMETLLSPQGLYAVFIHKGPASEGPRTYDHIFRTWMPASKYTVDDRPHFAVMGDKYKKEEADSEEEIWIPIKEKG